MKQISKLFMFAALFLAAGIMHAPAEAEAQTCLTTLFSGMTSSKTKNYEMATVRKRPGYVGYETGWLELSGSNLASSTDDRFYSNRVTSIGQLFDMSHPNGSQITITPSGGLTIKEWDDVTNTWSTNVLSNPTCFSNLITWDDGGMRFYTLSYGDAQTIIF